MSYATQMRWEGLLGKSVLFAPKQVRIFFFQVFIPTRGTTPRPVHIIFMTYGYVPWEVPQGHPDDGTSWLSGSNFMTRIMGFSFVASLLQSNSYMVGSAKLFLLGTIIESGRRFCQWLIERFRIRQYTNPLKPFPRLLTGLHWFDRILHNRTIHRRRSCLWMDHSLSCMSSLYVHPTSFCLWSSIADTRKHLEAIARVSRNGSIFVKEMGCPSKSPYPIRQYDSWIRSNIRGTATLSMERILGGNQARQGSHSPLSRVWGSVISYHFRDVSSNFSMAVFFSALLTFALRWPGCTLVEWERSHYLLRMLDDGIWKQADQT